MKRMRASNWPVAIGALALGVSMNAACEPTDRGEVRPPVTTEVQDDAGAISTEGETELPMTPADTPPSEEPAPIATLQPGTGLGGQATSGSCEADAGTCVPVGDAGPLPSVCVTTGPRDCTSGLDNDCDGQPDNIIDDVCLCVPGSVELCEEHPDFDGNGLCKPGTRTCVPGEGNLTSDWGACEGAVGPGEQDSCTTPGDDTDCDGAPNSGCTCVDGQTQPCGSSTDQGVCQIGTSTCVGGAFGQCVGAIAPAPRDTCTQGDDSNCNGIPNEGCGCVNGATQQCGPTDTGPCSFGTQTCVNGNFGACVGAVNPAPNDSCAQGNDATCNGIPNEGCGCINGATRRCGATDTGACSFGTETCVNGNFGACQGAVNPSPRNCGSAQDNDCDGEPDNTIDNVCECSPGQGNGPCSGDPENSRCNGQGQCASCQSDTDCSLVSLGRNTCLAGRCIALVEVGEECREAGECASRSCEDFYVDQDRDGFSPSRAGVERLCSNASFAPVGKTRQEPIDSENTDCLDSNLNVSPAQENFFVAAIPGLTGPLAYDYNCDGVPSYIHEEDTRRSVSPANAVTCNFAPVDLCDGGRIWRRASGPDTAGPPDSTSCGTSSFLEICGAVDTQSSFPGLGCINNDIVPLVVSCR